MGSNDTLMAHPHGQFRKVKRHITCKRKSKHSGIAQVIAWRKLKRRAGRIIEARHKNKHRSINCKRKLKSSTNWSPSVAQVKAQYQVQKESQWMLLYIYPLAHTTSPYHESSTRASYSVASNARGRSNGVTPPFTPPHPHPLMKGGQPPNVYKPDLNIIVANSHVS